MNDRLEFWVPGPPVGYYAQASRSLGRMSPDQRRRAEEYRGYQEKVRIFALQAGAKLPIKASKAFPLEVETAAWFKNEVHPDPENVHKGIKDAIIPEDKHTGGYYFPPLYREGKEEVGVWVRIRKVDSKILRRYSTPSKQ